MLSAAAVGGAAVGRLAVAGPLPALARGARAGRHDPVHPLCAPDQGALRQRDRAVPAGPGAAVVALPGRRSRHCPRRVAPAVPCTCSLDEPARHYANDFDHGPRRRALPVRGRGPGGNVAAAAGGLPGLQSGHRLAGQPEVRGRSTAIDPPASLRAAARVPRVRCSACRRGPAASRSPKRRPIAPWWTSERISTQRAGRSWTRPP